RVNLKVHYRAANGSAYINAPEDVLGGAYLLLQVEKFLLDLAEPVHGLIEAGNGKFSDLLLQFGHRLASPRDRGDLDGPFTLQLSMAPPQLHVALARRQTLFEQPFEVARLLGEHGDQPIVRLDKLLDTRNLFQRLFDPLCQDRGLFVYRKS